jgi:hypothetical protein
MRYEILNELLTNEVPIVKSIVEILSKDPNCPVNVVLSINLDINHEHPMMVYLKDSSGAWVWRSLNQVLLPETMEAILEKINSTAYCGAYIDFRINASEIELAATLSEN